MYVLESSTGGVAPVPFTGDVVRIDPNGARTVLANGLLFPTAMTFGADGSLYVSNFGFGGPAGAGQIVRIDVARLGHAPAALMASFSTNIANATSGGEVAGVDQSTARAERSSEFGHIVSPDFFGAPVDGSTAISRPKTGGDGAGDLSEMARWRGATGPLPSVTTEDHADWALV